MRIISIDWRPLAIVLAIAYAALGLSAFIAFAVGSDEKFVLPVGIVLPLFHLNLSLTLARSSDLFANVFQCMGAVLGYALTGWITGIAVALGFNFIAKRLGGINAKYVSTVLDETRKTSSV
jgi:hypothetical protein